jgi:hypothetical protein
MKPSRFLCVALCAMTFLCWGPLRKGSGQPPSSENTQSPVPELIVAVRRGDHARIKELLAKGADPNVRDLAPLPCQR